MVAKGYASREADQAFARARQLCEQLNRPAQLVSVLFGQFVIRFQRAELKQLRQDAEEIRQLGEASNDVPLEWLGCRYCGLACFGLGELSAARAYLERGLVLSKSEDRLVYSALPVEHIKEWTSFWLSRTLCLLGYFDHAQKCIDELRPDAPVPRVIALMAAWFFGWNVGSEPGWLLRHADELLALADEQGFAGWRPLGTMQRGCSLAALGHADDGVAQITAGLADYRATGTVLGVPSFLTWMADAHGMAGQPQAGQEQLDEALQLCRVTGERTSEAETLRLRGELLISTGDPVGAEASFREALALARQQSAKLWELRSATSLAQLWRDQGKRTEAHDLLAPVYGWFTEGFDTLLLQEAKALLQNLQPV